MADATKKLKVVLTMDDKDLKRGTDATSANMGLMSVAFVKAQIALDVLRKTFEIITWPIKKAIDFFKDLAGWVVDFGKEAIRSAGEFEQFAIAFDVMLGSVDKRRKLMKEITDFAIKTPFDLPTLVQGSKRLLAFGVEMEDIIPFLEMLGNVSAGLDVPMSRLIINFGQVKTLGRLMGRELKDFQIAGVPLGPMLAQIAGVTEDVIAKMVTAGEVTFPMVVEAFEAMSGSGGRFEDLMIRQSRTLPGAIANIQDAIGIFGRELVGVTEEGEIRVGSLFDVIRVAFVGVADTMTEMRGRFSEVVTHLDSLWLSFTAGIKEYWESSGKVAVEEIIGHIQTIMGDLETLIGDGNAEEFMNQLGSDTAKAAVDLLDRAVVAFGKLVDYVTSDQFKTDFGNFINDMVILAEFSAKAAGSFLKMSSVFAGGVLDIGKAIEFEKNRGNEDEGQHGIPNIPRTGSYLLHKGERVVPKTGADVGGSNYAPAINFYGSISVRSQSDIDQIANQVARVLGRQSEIERWHG